MKIAIISDTHNNLLKLQQALEIIKLKNIKLIFHCGDVGGEANIKELSKINAQIYITCGNTDDFVYLNKIINTNFIANIKIFESAGEIDIDNKKIAITHYPDLAKNFAYSGKYNIVFFGHTHKKVSNHINNTQLINPGDIENRYYNASFVIYDTINNKTEFINLNNKLTDKWIKF